jgi:MFS family permease
LVSLSVPADDPGTFRAGRGAVHALNFFVAAMQTGFGPFLSVWLVSQGWSLTDVGIALSVGTVAGLAAQLPGGGLVDRLAHQKRNITAIALAVVAASALMIAVAPMVSAVMVAQVLHSLGSAVITPAIAALTLALCGNDSFSERLGGNARYASIGSALAAGAFGLASTHLGERSIFLITAALALPAIALFAIQPGPCPPTEADHMAIAHPKDRDTAPWVIFRDPVMHIFAFCVILFHLCNAALLPLALGGLSQRGVVAGFVVPAAVIVPQLIVAMASPWAGSAARQIGRRTVLLVGFVALPARALLFACEPDPVSIDVIQVLDGVSATVLGLMLPLIAADLTRKTGHLNLAIGSFGLAAGLGATFSTTVAGWVADRMGSETAFVGLALVGGMATALLAFAMPETRPEDQTQPA